MMMMKFRKFAVFASPRPCSRKCRARQRSVKRNRMAKAKWRNLQARHNHAFTLHGPGVAVMRPHGHPTGTSQRPHSALTAPHSASQRLTGTSQAPHRHLTCTSHAPHRHLTGIPHTRMSCIIRACRDCYNRSKKIEILVYKHRL